MRNSGLTGIADEIAKAFYSDMRATIEGAAKLLPALLITVAVVTMCLFTVIICVFHYVIGLEKINGKDGASYLISPKNLLLIKNFENYYNWERKSYSDDSRKVDFEKDYKLNWELLYAIDVVSNKDYLLIENSFNALKPVFVYKESRVIRNVTTSNKGSGGRPGMEEKNPAAVEKVLLPVVIDTYYKKLTYEYETRAFTTTEEIDGKMVTTVIRKEVVKDGFPIETDTVSARFLPYINSIGIDDKDKMALLLSTARQKLKEPNEGIEYVERYLSRLN